MGNIVGQPPLVNRNLEKEAEKFSDSEQGKLLIELANQRLIHIQKQKDLTEKKFQIENEVLESSKLFLEKLEIN